MRGKAGSGRFVFVGRGSVLAPGPVLPQNWGVAGRRQEAELRRVSLAAQFLIGCGSWPECLQLKEEEPRLGAWDDGLAYLVQFTRPRGHTLALGRTGTVLPLEKKMVLENSLDVEGPEVGDFKPNGRVEHTAAAVAVAGPRAGLGSVGTCGN